MAEQSRNWYSSKGKGKDGEGKGEKKVESVHERHARERGEAHQRHSKARDDVHKQQEEELAQMAERHASEAEGAVGNGPEPAAGPIPTAAAAAPTQGGAAATPEA